MERRKEIISLSVIIVAVIGVIGLTTIISSSLFKSLTTDNNSYVLRGIADTYIPVINEVDKLIKEFKPYLIIEEDVPPALQNSMTVKTLSTLKGGMLTLACINGISIRYILPNVWQSALKILKSKGSTKKQSIDFINGIYNTAFKFVSESSKKNEDDITDSICLVHYYINKVKKGN